MKLMKYYLLAAFILPASMLFAQSEYSYVGASTCGMCHKSEKQGKQLSIWEKSAHAKAFETLKTAEADKIAKEKGFTTPAAKTAECLQCHASGYNVDAKMLGKKFKVEDGVQCETCHGPGSEYKDMKVMKDEKMAVSKGLKVYEKVEELCVTCHNEKSPTFKKADFAELWKKIAHEVPETK